MAVLGAAPGLGRQDSLDLDLRPAPGEADVVGQGGEGGHLLRGKGGQLGQLVEGQLALLVDE